MNRFSLLAALLLLACAPRSAPEATVSGKTVYRCMGVEGVAIEVQHQEAGRWVPHATVRSGYHGSFAVRLRPGEYRLFAQTALPSAGGDSLALQGTLERLQVRPRARRIGQLLLRLEPSVPPPGGGANRRSKRPYVPAAR